MKADFEYFDRLSALSDPIVFVVYSERTDGTAGLKKNNIISQKQKNLINIDFLHETTGNNNTYRDAIYASLIIYIYMLKNYYNYNNKKN